MFRYSISLTLVFGLIGCGKVIPPLAMDLNNTAEKRSVAYNPANEPKTFLVRSASAAKPVNGLRGVGISSTYAGFASALVSAAQSIFTYYPTVVAAMYGMTIKTGSFARYYQNYFYPNYGNGRFPYWGGNSQLRGWGAYKLNLTTTSNVRQYRIEIKYPQDSNYDGYTASGSPYGRQQTSISAWDVLEDGKKLSADLVVLDGSTIYLEVANGKTSASASSESPTLNMTATVTPLPGYDGSAASTAAVTVSRDFSNLVAKTSVPAGYENQVTGDTLTAGNVSIDVSGINNSSASLPNYCYYGYCFQTQ